jgi:hypothetical protein
MVVLLRRTNRLAMHLASNGHALYEDNERSVEGQIEWVRSVSSLVEVEFFSSSTADPTGDNVWAFPFLITTRNSGYDMMSWLTEADSERIAEDAGDFSFPAQSNRLSDQLNCFLTYPFERDTGYDILPFQEPGDHNVFLQHMEHIFRHDQADILWLSKTEFVSLHYFRSGSREHNTNSSYAYALSVDQWKFLAYSLPHLDNANGELRFGPVSDLPLRFVYYMLSPVSHEVSSFEVEMTPATPVDATLALIPRTDQRPLDNTTVLFPYTSTGILHALSSFPFHHRVRLRFEDWYGIDVPPQELNDLLLRFRFPVHLEVPRTLLDFECENETFTTNPSFTSLTFSSCHAPLSTRMLNGIGHNKGMKHLVIDCWDWDYRRNDMVVPSVIKAVFRGALQGGTNRKILTLVSRYENNERGYETDESEPPKSVREAFERLGKDLLLTSQKRHCAAQLHWRFPRSRGTPRMKSNKLWDSEFSPALVLNCLHEQPGGCPPAILLGLASR